MEVSRNVVAAYMHNLHPHTHPSFIPAHPPRPPHDPPLTPTHTYSSLSPTPTHPQCPNRLRGVEKCPCVPCGRWYWWKEYFPCCGCKQSPASPHRAQVRSSEIHYTDYLAHWTPVVHVRGENIFLQELGRRNLSTITNNKMMHLCEECYIMCVCVLTCKCPRRSDRNVTGARLLI